MKKLSKNYQIKIIKQDIKIMNKSDITFFEIEFNINNFDIITANSAYYTFIGDEKCLKLINVFAEKAREEFLKHLKKKDYGQCFFGVIKRAGKDYGIIACLVPSAREDVGCIHIFDLNYLYEANAELTITQNEYNAMLGILGTDTFIYNPLDESISVYSYAQGRSLKYRNKLAEYIKELFQEYASSEKINTLKESIKSGIKNFEYILEKDDEKIMISGTALFYNGMHIKTVGVIRKLNGNIIEGVTYRKDQLTGAFLKEDITNIARTRVKSEYKDTSIAIIDIDDFKQVNDRFGHKKGDEVLRRCAEIMFDSVGDKGYVGRIGGDEFIVVMFDVPKLEDRKSILRSIKNSVASAYTVENDGFRVTTSIGSAHYPGDVDNFEDLYNLSDILVYRAKTMGKNRYATYEYRIQGDVKEILRKGMDNLGVNNRDKASKGELICRITDQIYLEEFDKADTTEYLTKVFEEVRECFKVDRVVIYNLDKTEVMLQCGKLKISDEVLTETIDYIHSEALEKLYKISTMKGNVIVYNNTMNIINVDNKLYDTLKKQGILTINQHRIKGESGNNYLISYEDISLQHTWNSMDHYMLRALDSVIKQIL